MEKRGNNNMEIYSRVINDVMNGGLLDLGEALYEENKKTYKHCRRVFDYCFMIGQKLRLSVVELEYLAVAAFYHDVGKIGISKKILDKPVALTGDEMTIMETHPRISARVLRAAGGSNEAVKALACHHERYDGKGYPYGICGENIPLLARILAVADAYSAMTSVRSHARTLVKEEALDRLAVGGGTQFDPQIVGSFIEQVEAAQLYTQGEDREEEVA